VPGGISTDVGNISKEVGNISKDVGNIFGPRRHIRDGSPRVVGAGGRWFGDDSRAIPSLLRAAGPQLEKQQHPERDAPEPGACYPAPVTRSPDAAAILRKYGIEPDPVIEAYKKDVDRTLLRQNLMRTPEERWANLRAATRLADELRRAGAPARGR
jgi:hypothetical protein